MAQLRTFDPSDRALAQAIVELAGDEPVERWWLALASVADLPTTPDGRLILEVDDEAPRLRLAEIKPAELTVKPPFRGREL